MKYYKDKAGQVYAFESDGSQDNFIPKGAVMMTDAEINAHLNPPSEPPSKQELLNSITVTTQSGKTFHGDEESQDRIARALQIAGFTSQTQTGWKLTDGNTHMVTVEELQEALTLAMIEVGRIVGAID